MGKWDALIRSLLNLNSISSYLPNLCVLLTMKFIFNLPLSLLSHNTVGRFSMVQQCRCICRQQRKNRLVVYTVLIQLCNGMCTECVYKNVFPTFFHTVFNCLGRSFPHQSYNLPLIRRYLSLRIIFSDGILIESLHASLHSLANQQKASDKIIKLYPI